MGTLIDSVEVGLGGRVCVENLGRAFEIYKGLVSLDKSDRALKDDFIAEIIENSEYSRDEKVKLCEVSDTLIGIEDRAHKGDFYTPAKWVKVGHDVLNKVLGKDWKNRFTVWDCACGTQNLTRDYTFGELYCSTLEDGDVKLGSLFNREGTAFQYDFLNDDVDLFEDLGRKKGLGYKLSEDDFVGSKLYAQTPTLVKSLLTDKPLLFLINPPYKNNSSTHCICGKKGSEVQSSKIRICMIEQSMGNTDELYLQFLFRICKFAELFEKNVYIGLYTPVSLLTCADKVQFREYFLSRFSFNYGFFIRASEFSNVMGNWSIAFSVFTPFEALMCRDMFVYNVGGLENEREKVVYNLDFRGNASDWVVDEKQKKRQGLVELPCVSSALNVTNKSRKVLSDSLGSLSFNGNKVEVNQLRVSLFSQCGGVNGWKMVSVTEDNFERVCAYFASRKLIVPDWVTGMDSYRLPNSDHPCYDYFVPDSIVYSLFCNGAYQVSMRDVNFRGTSVNIINNFFFMSKDEIKDLAVSVGFNEMLEDLNKFGDDRFVYNKLKGMRLSLEAQEVLNKARDLIRLSFKDRVSFSRENPQFHLNTWDAGWYQIKSLLKVHYKVELTEFKELLRELENKMRPSVYTLGFLM